MRRVAITGLGVVSSIGLSVADFLASLRTGRGGIRPLDQPGSSELRFSKAAQALGYTATDHFEPKQADMIDRFAQFALVAARQALRDAAVDWTPGLRENTAVITGSCAGGQNAQEQGFVDLYKSNKNRVSPLTIPRTMANAGASHISMEFGLTGPAYTVSTACSSAGHAIGQAFWMVRSGAVDMALAGGSEAPFSFGFLKAWEAMRVISQDTCRPFSRDRSGLILGEGGAMLVMEPLEAAQARGATIYAEIVGFGMSSDASHVTQPAAAGAIRAMRSALADGGVDTAQVDYINAHGTGTAANDSNETLAIRTLLGARADAVAVSSTKSMHGHTLGAAAALEAAATVLSLRHSFLPATLNFNERDPACDLDVVPNQPREASIEYALSNSFAFGGLNAVLAFRKI
jgi:nodulation protein E